MPSTQMDGAAKPIGTNHLSSHQPLTYTSTGVDYEPVDRFKRLCQVAAGRTTLSLEAHKASEPAGIRGESAYLIDIGDSYLAHVEEGLGTKNLVADAMLERTGINSYRNIGIDTVAAIVNDMITVGAMPMAIAMHAAVGDAKWFDLHDRGRELAAGFADGCTISGAVWSGGETPVLKDVVARDAVLLAGSGVGILSPKANRICGNVADGDAIVCLSSSGIHANGVTLCRKLAEQLPNGYMTELKDGRTFGQALLEPTRIYSPFIKQCLGVGIVPHYAVNITGHGWRKLMRLREPFIYHIHSTPALPPLFEFIMSHGGLTATEAFGTFNMGAGFAVFVEKGAADDCIKAALSVGIHAWNAGTVKQGGGRKAVEIAPLNISFDSDTLQVRE